MPGITNICKRKWITSKSSLYTYTPPGMTFHRYAFIVSYLVASVIFYCSCNNYSAQDDHPEYFKAIFNLADSAKDDQKDNAFRIMDSAFSSSPVRPGTGDYFENYNRKRDFYFSGKKDYQKAMLYTDSILSILKNKINSEKFAIKYAETLFLKGDIYFAQKDFEEGLHFYFTSKRFIADNLKNPCSLSGYNGRLGLIFFEQGKYVQAASYFYKDYYNRLECEGNKFMRFVYMQNNLANMGFSFSKAGMIDSSWFYFNKALDFIEKEAPGLSDSKDYAQLAKAVIYARQAELLVKEGKPDKAEELFIRSINRTKTEYLEFTQQSMLSLTSMYIDSKKLNKADSLLRLVEISMDSLKTEIVLTAYYKIKSDLLDAHHLPAKADMYLRQYIKLQDSIEARNKKFAATDVSRNFENKEQRAINETLIRNNQLKSLYLLIAVILTLMAFIIIFLIKKNLKRSARHIRELNQKNKELENAFISLEQSHKEKYRIVSIVAHDLRNPISAIRNLVFSLLKKEQQEQQRDTLELIETSCTNSLMLIGDLMNDQMQESEAEKEMVDMALLLKNCVALYQAKAGQKNQQINLETEHADILLNTHNMWRVISNVIDNAIKFSQPDSAINVKLDKRPASVLLSVNDKGIGIPGNLQNKIFDKPEEAKRKGTRGEDTHGLGLAISKKIVEEHHGKIWFESIINEGSTFYIELPLLN